MLFLLEEFYMLTLILLCLIFMSFEKSIWRYIHKLTIFFCFLLFFLLYEGFINMELIIFLWKYNLKIDYFTIFLKLIIIIYLLNYNILIEKLDIIEKLFIKEYIILIWLAILALCFIIMANELFIIYLALELQNLILYVLTNLRRKISIAIEAGIKYYIMGSFSSCILLYGLVMLFGIFGTLDLIEINYLISGSLFENMISLWYVFFLFLLVLIGFLFKLGVAPFHWWVPEVYGGALSNVVLYFTFIPKISLVIILYKYYNLLLIYFSFFFSYIFFFFTFCSLIIGFFFSLYEKNIIKFLAYSGIFNNGFFMAIFSNGTQVSFISLFYFFIPYMFILLGIFFILLNVRKLNKEKLITIYDFSLIGKNNIFLASSLSLLFLSLAGIPPLSGFFGKFFVFFSLLLNKYWFLFFFLVIFSIAACFYYFRLIRLIFFSQKLSYIFLQLIIHPSFLVFYVLFSIYFLFFYDYIFMCIYIFFSYNIII